MSTIDRPELYTIDRAAQDVLFREARTAKTFTDEPVTDEQVRAIYDLVKWAPTSFNQQPLRVVLVRSDEARQRLVAHLAEPNQAKTRTAPLTAILAADLEFHEHLPQLYPVFPARDLYVDAPDQRAESARLNATLQVAYFLLGIRAIGLAAGPMTGFDSKGVDAEFFPAGQYTSLVVVNLGKPGPDAWGERHPRLPYEQVVTEV